ncbi:MAG: DinB family protein [Edaphobacter sp.]
MTDTYIEPWLRGTLTEVDAVRRQVLHTLELAEDDMQKWCGGLSDAEINARPFGIAPVSFHLRHIVGSLDRLLTYAEGGQLDAAQMTTMRGELGCGGTTAEVMQFFKDGLAAARRRLLLISPKSYEEARGVGRKMLPTTLGALVIHCADHTHRHVGQAVTTSKVVVGMRG